MFWYFGPKACEILGSWPGTEQELGIVVEFKGVLALAFYIDTITGNKFLEHSISISLPWGKVIWSIKDTIYLKKFSLPISFIFRRNSGRMFSINFYPPVYLSVSLLKPQ